MSNLNQRKMYYHRDSTAEDGVCPKFRTVPHAVMTTISCNGYATFNGLQFGKQLALIFLPKEVDGWEDLAL